MSEYTDFAGLLRLAAGESLSTDGWSFTGRNIEIIDRLLRAGAVTHRHDAHAALANPTATAPTVSQADTGGQIPADLPIAVGYTWIDADGGETTLSPLTTVTTPPGLTSPTDSPTAAVDNLAGTLLAGTYYYALTVVDGSGGETSLGPSATVTVPPGFTNSEVVLSDLDTIVTSVGGVGWRMWRSVAGGQFALIAVGSAATFTDDGINCVDCAVQPPDPDIGLGTTNATNRIIVTVPATHPTEAVKFRIYASLDGSFIAPALLDEFDDTDFGSPLEFTALTFLDESPPPVSNTIQGAEKIDPDTELLDWNWKRPVDSEVDLPLIGNVEGDVRLVKDTSTFYSWDGTAWVPSPPGHAILDDTTPMAGRPNLSFLGNGLSVTDDGPNSATVVEVPGLEVQDEGTPLPFQAAIDFVGSGVSVADDPTNAKTVVTISGGGGGGSQHIIYNNPVGAYPARGTLEFAGDSFGDPAVEVTDDSGGDSTIVGIYGPHTIFDEGVAGTQMDRRPGLSFEGAGVTVTDNPTDGVTEVTIPGGGGGGSAHVITDEGTPLTARTDLDFVGAGVTVTDDAGGDRTVVTIPGGSGVALDIAVFNTSTVTVSSGGNTTADWAELRDDGGDFSLGNAVMGGTDTQINVLTTGVFDIEYNFDMPNGAYLGMAGLRHYNSSITLQREFADVKSALNPTGNPATITLRHTIGVTSGDILVPIFSQDSGSNKNASNAIIIITKQN